MKKAAFLIATGLMFSSAAVVAQSTDAASAVPPQDTAAPLPDSSAPPADAAAPPAPADAAAPPAAGDSASFTEDQIQSYAQALVQIQVVAADTALDDAGKQTKMAAIVTEVGLDPQTFNDIGRATQTDPAVQAQVQAAVTNAQAAGRG